MLELLVAAGAGPSLIDCDWLNELKLDWTTIHSVQTENKPQSLLQQYSTVFNDETGKLQGVATNIPVNPAVPPRVYTVPHFKVEIDLKRLQQTDSLTPIQHSDWETPIVAIIKSCVVPQAGHKGLWSNYLIVNPLLQE